MIVVHQNAAKENLVHGLHPSSGGTTKENDAVHSLLKGFDDILREKKTDLQFSEGKSNASSKYLKSQPAISAPKAEMEFATTQSTNLISILKRLEGPIDHEDGSETNFKSEQMETSPSILLPVNSTLMPMMFLPLRALSHELQVRISQSTAIVQKPNDEVILEDDTQNCQPVRGALPIAFNEQDQAQMQTNATAVVVSYDIRSFPEPVSNRIEMHTPGGSEQSVNMSLTSRVDSSSRNGSQTLNVVLAMPDAEHIRCVVRNLGETLSLTVMTSDADMAAYLRDNDQVLRANLEKMGIQADALQVKLSMSSSIGNQDTANLGQQDLHSTYDGSQSSRRQKENSTRQEHQSEHKGFEHNEHSDKDKPVSANGRYL